MLREQQIYEPSRSEKELSEKAKQKGLRAYFPQPNEILLDIDDPSDNYVTQALLPIFKENGFPLLVTKITRSAHGGKHVYLRAPRDLSTIERIALEACLGSDRKRAALGFCYNEQDERNVASCLFEKVPEETVMALPVMAAPMSEEVPF